MIISCNTIVDRRDHVQYLTVSKSYSDNCTCSLKPHSHCAGVATVHPDAGQPVYRDAPGHIS